MFRTLPVVLLLFLFCSPVVMAESYTYDFNGNCGKAYQNFMSLHTAEARSYVITEMKSNPYNLMATYIADYEDCILLLLNCDKSEYRERAGHLEARIALLEKGSKSSPWYRFCLGGIYLHWALINTRFGDQYKAAINFHRSYSLLKENRRLFPKFEYNNVFTGLQEAVVGTLPGNYKWLASIFGMRGDLKKGVRELSDFLKNNTSQQLLYPETVLYYLYTRFYLLNEQKEVWDFLNSPQFETHSNLLNAFVKVNISMDFRKSDAAIATLKDAAMEANYNKYPIFNYQMGNALLNRLDTACANYFYLYLENNKSDLLIKDCWQKMAFCRYLNNDVSRATYCLEQVRKQGNTRLDADKQASKFAENRVWPKSKLLAARLLIEGGYYPRALEMLREINERQLSQADRVEYTYRSGKAYQEEGNNTKALEFYQTTLNAGKGRHEQFAARASLQMGIIYEHSGMQEQALTHYKECLNMPTHDFQNSIDQQAKAGINRLEEK